MSLQIVEWTKNEKELNREIERYTALIEKDWDENPLAMIRRILPLTSKIRNKAPAASHIEDSRRGVARNPMLLRRECRA